MAEEINKSGRHLACQCMAYASHQIHTTQYVSSKEQDMNKNNSVHGWAVEVNKAGSLSIVTNLRRRKKSR